MSFKDNYYKVSDTTCDYCDSSNCKKEEMYHFFKDTNTHSEHTTDYIVCLDYIEDKLESEHHVTVREARQVLFCEPRIRFAEKVSYSRK